MLVLRADSTVDPLIVLKFWFIVCAVYFWEFITTIDYEWSVFRGHQRYRWTIWIYSISRLCCLIDIVIILLNFGLTSEINCRAWFISGWVLTSLGCYGLGSVLIMLRIFAIWERNKVVMAISAAIWVTNLGFQFTGVVKLHTVWVPAASACVTTDIMAIKGLCISMLTTDVTLLLIMLAGLLRIRRRDRTFIDLAYTLWKQGVIWLLIATVAELPQVLLLFVTQNVELNSLFLVPSSITIVIAATRTYRELTIYTPTPSSSGPGSSGPPKANRLVSSRPHEEYPMSLMNRYDSHPNSDVQLAGKPIGLHDDVESQGKEMIGHEELAVQ